MDRPKIRVNHHRYRSKPPPEDPKDKRAPEGPTLGEVPVDSQGQPIDVDRRAVPPTAAEKE